MDLLVAGSNISDCRGEAADSCVQARIGEDWVAPVHEGRKNLVGRVVIH